MEKKETAIFYRVCYMYIYSIKYICIKKLYIFFVEIFPVSLHVCFAYMWPFYSLFLSTWMFLK